MAIELNDANFAQEIEQHNGVAFVDFWAPWCGPCKMMAPVFEKMADKYPAIKFGKINTDENMQKPTEFSITGIPCIIVFKAGKEVERLVGFKPEPDFEISIKKYL